jgi:hypothetical protein
MFRTAGEVRSPLVNNYIRIKLNNVIHIFAALFFTSKQKMAEELAEEVERLHYQFITSGEQTLLRDEHLQHMEDLSLEQYLDADLLHRLPLNLMTYNR